MGIKKSNSTNNMNEKIKTGQGMKEWHGMKEKSN